MSNSGIPKLTGAVNSEGSNATLKSLSASGQSGVVSTSVIQEDVGAAAVPRNSFSGQNSRQEVVCSGQLESSTKVVTHGLSNRSPAVAIFFRKVNCPQNMLLFGEIKTNRLSKQAQQLL